jgi:dTDP-4-amino-4,6-dideoxygalactose transaminase
MTKKIYVTQPTLAPLDEVINLLQGIWDNGIMTHNGPLVQRFEQEFCQQEKIARMVAVCNGTLALQMAIRALELKGEIITTPFSFIATINSIIWEGCTPVFADIDPDTFNINPDKIETSITSRTVAIMPVHVFGNPCDIEAIDTIAQKHDLKVIYDAAHAVGSSYKGKPLLSYGDISATSFHATKMLNTAEGGGCIACNEELHRRLQMIRFFGYNEQKDVEIDGFNGKMTEVHAAIGLANLKLLTAALEDRREKYALYKAILSQRQSLTFQRIDGICNCSYFPVVFSSEQELLHIQEALLKENIVPRRYFYPSLNTYTSIVKYVPMPASESLADRILCLPLYYNLSKENICKIAQIIIEN